MTLEGTDPAALTARIDELETALDNSALLAESLTALRLQLEDEALGWIRIGRGAESISLDQVRELARRAYEAYHGNSLIHRAVDVSAHYVWGRGVNIASPQHEVQAAITDFLTEPTNAAELGHVGLMEKERTVRLQGQLFLVLFTNTETGEVLVRTLPFADIVDVITDPDDYQQTRFVARVRPGSASGETIYHPALGYDPDAKPPTVDGHAVLWNAPVLFAPLPRVCREPWAVPDVAGALVWARSYSTFLQNISSINAALAQVALLATAKSPAAFAAFSGLFNTGTRKPAIPTASTAILPDGSSLTPFKTAGVTTSADEGRRFMLMVAAHTGVPEHILQGDPATGNLATSKTMERPFELAGLNRQRWWEDVLERVAYYAVTARALAPGCTAISGTVVLDSFGRKAVHIQATRSDPLTGSTSTAAEPVELTVSFPSILEHDMAQEVRAVISAATLGGQKPAGVMDYPTLQRLLLAALNVPDVDDLVAEMDQDDIENQRNPEPPPELGGALTAPGAGAGDEDDTDEATDEAYSGLVGSLRSLSRALRERAG